MLPHNGDCDRFSACRRDPERRPRQTDMLREAGLLLHSEPIVLHKSGDYRCEGDGHAGSDRPSGQSNLLREARILLHGRKIVLR